MKKALLSLLLAVACMPLAFAQVKTQRTIITNNLSACETFTWAVNQQTYTTDTVVYYINSTDDTLFVLNLTINTPYTSDQVIVSTRCSYSWRGNTYTTTGNYSDTVVAPTGSGLCDSVFNVVLTISPVETDLTTVSTCGSYTWHDSTYTASGIYNDTTINGSCTHIDCLDLSIVSTIHTNVSVEHCGDYTWYDSVYSTSGSYTHQIIDSVTNCDSIHHLNLTIVVDTAVIERDSACGSKTWRGHTYTLPGLYHFDDTNATTHCVTYRQLSLNIKTPRQPQNDTSMVGCNSVVFTVSSLTGTSVLRFYNDTVFDTILADRRWNRCYDSTIHLNVTIHKSGYDTTYVNACDSFYWNLNKRTYYYTPQTTPSFAFATDTFGCDSMMYLMLRIEKSPVISAINGDWHLNAGETAVLYPTCTAGATYKWTYGNNQTSREDTLRIENVQGNIDVALEATLTYAPNYACHDTSWITIVTFVGIDNTEAANISLYPNPTVGQLNIESAEGIAQVTIFNTLGQKVLVDHNLGNKAVMNLTNLPKGNYTMQLTLNNGETVIRKFIITK